MSRKNIVSALSLIIIGILMIFAGGFISYIHFTEITRPNYDANYKRYVGSSFPRILGILILMGGLTLFWGSSIFLVYTYYRDGPKRRHDSYFRHMALPITSTTLDEKDMKENYIA